MYQTESAATGDRTSLGPSVAKIRGLNVAVEDFAPLPYELALRELVSDDSCFSMQPQYTGVGKPSIRALICKAT